MITPRFELRQTDEFVVIVLRVRYIKASSADWYAQGKEFKFHCRPYFLRLTLPHEVVEDGRERAHYDVDKGELSVFLPKAVQGQHFADLDMLTTLLQPEETGKRHPLIEVLSGTRNVTNVHVHHEDSDSDSGDGVVLEDNLYDWSLPQSLAPVVVEEALESEAMQLSARHYGFGEAYSNFFEKDSEYLREVLDNPSPDELTLAEVRSQRVLQEEEDLDEETLWNDSLLPDEEIGEALRWVSPTRLRLNERTKDIGHGEKREQEGQDDEDEDDEGDLGIELSAWRAALSDASHLQDTRNRIGSSSGNGNGGLLELHATVEPSEATSLPPRDNRVERKNRVLIEEVTATNHDRIEDENEKEIEEEEEVPPPLEDEDLTVQAHLHLKAQVKDTPLSPQRHGRIMLEREPQPQLNEDSDEGAEPTRDSALVQVELETGDAATWTDEEREQLLRLPRKEYLLDAAHTKRALFGLVDILFASCFDLRLTRGQGTVESSWTIAKVSATLAWCDCFDSARAALVAAMRRALIYPLLRSWPLALQVARDVVDTLSLGKRATLKALLYARRALAWSDAKHALNRLYLDDYLVWLQFVSRSRLRRLAQHVGDIVASLTLPDLDLPLDWEDTLD